MQFDEWQEQRVEVADLGGQELGSPAQLSQSYAGGVADSVSRAGAQAGQLGRKGVGGAMLETARRSLGPVTTRALA